jgi:hypothetical protein
VLNNIENCLVVSKMKHADGHTDVQIKLYVYFMRVVQITREYFNPKGDKALNVPKNKEKLFLHSFISTSRLRIDLILDD